MNFKHAIENTGKKNQSFILHCEIFFGKGQDSKQPFFFSHYVGYLFLKTTRQQAYHLSDFFLAKYRVSIPTYTYILTLKQDM